MESLFFMPMSDEFTKKWLRGISCLNLAQDVIDRHDVQFCEKLLQLYDIRRELVVLLEKTYVAPIIILRNKANWSTFVSTQLIVVETTKQFHKDELEFLQENKIPFVSNLGEHSDDDFGKSKGIKQLLDKYIATEPKPMGF